jgi:hypothetical protein
MSLTETESKLESVKSFVALTLTAKNKRLATNKKENNILFVFIFIFFNPFLIAENFVFCNFLSSQYFINFMMTTK